MGRTPDIDLDVDGSIETYTWDFDGDGVAEQPTSSPEVTHTYSSTGEFAVNVTAMDDDGDTASAEVSVTVGESQQGTLDVLNVTTGSINTCGQLCRVVSYNVTNPTEEAVTNVKVNATVRSGGQTVWTGNRTFTELPPGQTSGTETADLDATGVVVVNENDGQVTVLLEVTAGGESKTFEFEREM